MSDERRRVLDLLAQGRITVDEADRLLQAMTAASAEPAKNPEEKPKARFIRINVHKVACEHHMEKDVNIRVPLAIIRSGMRLGAIIPGIAGDRIMARLRERGLDVDLAKMDPAMIESMLAEMGEVNIDVDQGRAQVRITCE
jgi:DNA-binding transcriptional LysR family regulator